MTVPGQVTGVASANKAPAIAITWSAVSGATSYYIYKGIAASPTTLLAVVPSTQLAFFDWDISYGTLYYYNIKAYNSDGLGTVSSDVSRSITFSAPDGIFQLRSYTELLNGRNTSMANQGSGFLFQFRGMSNYVERDASQIDMTNIAGQPATSSIGVDFNGVTRVISFDFTRVDGFDYWFYAGVSGMDNAGYLQYLRDLMGVLQMSYGPFRYVVITNPVTLQPQYSPSTNPCYVMLGEVSFNKDEGEPSKGKFSVKFYVTDDF